MTEQEKPTGITFKDATHSDRTVDFEGRQVRIVSFAKESEMVEGSSARLELDLGDEYLVLLGYFSREGEFIETGRERPF